MVQEYLVEAIFIIWSTCVVMGSFIVSLRPNESEQM